MGFISPPSATGAFSDYTAPLPSGVRMAMPILMSLTPSLTASVVAFLFDDDVAVSLEEPLRKEYSTYTQKDPQLRFWHVIRFILTGRPNILAARIHFPDMIRREALKTCLHEIEDSCMKWVRDCLPGAFASLPGSRAPSAALLVTEKVRPLSAEACAIRAFDGLALNRYYDAWESTEWPGARLVLPRGWDYEGSRLLFACRRHDAFPANPSYHDTASNATIVQRAHDHIYGLLSRWTITCLLDSYHEALSALRDRTAHDGRYRPIRDLKKLRKLVRTTLYDICSCTQEIAEFSEIEHRYRFNVLEMSYVRAVPGGVPDLLCGFRESQKKRAQQVERDAAILQTMLSTSSDLSQTISNIRIQRTIVILTIVSICIALSAAYLSVKASLQTSQPVSEIQNH